MPNLVHEVLTPYSSEALAAALAGEPGVVLLRSAGFDSPQARYSFVTARPFLTFRSFDTRCELTTSQTPDARPQTQFGNPWRVLDELMARYELLDEVDLPFPLGGCFGYWGYDLRHFVEPKLPRRAVNDLELPDCHVGFHDSLVVFDHRLGKTWIVSTGLDVDGSRSEARAKERADWWHERLARWGEAPAEPEARSESASFSGSAGASPHQAGTGLCSNFTRDAFIARVEQAQRYIQAGDIYQVNLAQRLSAPTQFSGWELFERLLDVSPAPFAAYLDCGEFQVASSSPELFLRLSGPHITTRPIKGTRPRSADPTRDAQLTYELQTSPKEMAELVMITDLLRNDLGRVCEYGSVQVPELVRLERYPQVQHLVSTVEGRLRADVTHFAAFASCFPGGSITGAPKFRAMEIIDELEPVTRGPYCGCHGYLGFNRESQLSITIRTAVRQADRTHFHVGAGIVADSVAAAEYEETLAKARGFLAALDCARGRDTPVPQPAAEIG
ncbi:MAG: para-aminobenzoate synthetase component I [Limisphaerales bacterium]|nr:MAG: para-aminobenzoate synthetase component I [Limisphaerales bacterium]KAG0506934.1 MAG: para-aminobenzoate synthetase component I [Limisphaerales bacterium]TXT47157.1 MAG: para-aminobenzoate synthetase component I [Limisphaerales bacterium]